MVYAILDSGIFIAQTFPEPYSMQAIKLFNDLQSQHVQLIAPHLLHYEVCAVIRKLVYTERATTNEAQRALDKLLGYDVTLYFDQPLLKRAYDIATELNRPRAYDTQFLALAERFSCDFWTTDERFYNTAKDHFPAIKWIAKYQMG